MIGIDTRILHQNATSTGKPGVLMGQMVQGSGTTTTAVVGATITGAQRGSLMLVSECIWLPFSRCNLILVV